VYLKVSPIRGLRRFKGEVAYQLELLALLSDVQNMFHITVEKVLEGTRGTVAIGGVECTG
jgi:hypothetical protein